MDFLAIQVVLFLILKPIFIALTLAALREGTRAKKRLNWRHCP